MNDTIQTGSFPRVIGIHVALPQDSRWALRGVESTMLQRLVYGALGRAGLYQGEYTGVRQSGAFNGQFFGMIPVTEFGAALQCVADELSAVNLISVAHLAWLDRQEGIWRTERPLPEVISFKKRVADFADFCVARTIEICGKSNTVTDEVRQLTDCLKNQTGIDLSRGTAGE